MMIMKMMIAGPQRRKRESFFFQKDISYHLYLSKPSRRLLNAGILVEKREKRKRGLKERQRGANTQIKTS